MAVKNIALIFAGGSGERMANASTPKQFWKLQDKPVLAYTLEPFQVHREIDGIVLAAPADWLDYCAEMAKRYHFGKLSAVVPGGSSGQESIFIGLKKVRQLYGEDTVVLIHDGVRPLIDGATITSCIRCVQRYGSAVTVSPQTETVMLRGPDKDSCRIVDRDKCLVGRAPQCFWVRDIWEAHRRAEADRKGSFVDSASLMEHYGYEIHPVMGPTENIKITTALDFQIFCAVMEKRAGQKEKATDGGVWANDPGE